MTAGTPVTIRIVLVDDHMVVRAGLRMLIESQPGLAVVGEASNRSDALAVVAASHPDLILLDLDLGDSSGLDCIPELRAAEPGSRVLVLTGVRDAEAHYRAVRLGAMGVVHKENAAEILTKAIEKVHSGEVWLDRLSTAGLIGELTRSPPSLVDPEQERVASLTDREREVVKLVATGLKNKQIADRLYISETTVRHHLTSIFDKLGLNDRFELLIYAYRQGLAKPPA